MRNTQDKWTFIQNDIYPALSAKDVAYWKSNLHKILKVGLEFEFNLPNKKNGNCKGESNSCPCARMNEHDCWAQCALVEECESVRLRARCANNSKKCKDDNCEECDQYKLMCHGINCPNFVSACFICSDFTVDCKGCEFRYDPKKSPEHIRESMKKNFRPNNTYGTINESGVHSITTDGSLLGKKGAEVITIGRRVDYWEFYKMAKKIIDTSVKHGAYLNERCSIHMHLLASYYGKVVPDGSGSSIPNKINELEKDMPSIILANFHQLVRRYQNAMTWMVMALDEPERLTRWEKFRVSVLPISAILNSMRQVKQEVSHHAGGNKYGWVNYNYTEFSKSSGDVTRLHVEMRAADGMNSPSAVAALACMNYALMIKAVEISRYGVVEIESNEWMERAEMIKSALLNNMKSYQDGDRFGDTRNLRKYYEDLIRESMDLVRQLKHNLIRIGPAYQVLEKIAEKPIALRRCDGATWEQIEDDLAIIMTEEGKFENTLSEIMDLRIIDECKDVHEWVHEVTGVIKEHPDVDTNHSTDDEIMNKVRYFVEMKQNDGELVWSEPIGAPVLL